MNTTTPTPAPLSETELAAILESPEPRRWIGDTDNTCNRLLATLTAKDEIIARLTAERDVWEKRAEGAWSENNKFMNDALQANLRAETALSRVKVLEEALRRCRDTFHNYAALHYAKQTADGDAKAETNADLESMCDKALSPPTQVTEKEGA